ncbi:hypothetical protein LMG28614_03549 [Paraburkholderia ultramafica]|uniref:Uncharacterized protein n=1 Tax=Paraburkholderia ultramafica TaxID=1544867 RepID=A0A6S7CLA2_9BURK|nr:hypothetical protein LMG28614_03549 [Paraburkholderia ultramafica]
MVFARPPIRLKKKGCCRKGETPPQAMPAAGLAVMLQSFQSWRLPSSLSPLTTTPVT